MEASSALVSGAADAPAQSGSPAPNWAGNQSLVPTEAPSFDAATTEPSDMDVAVRHGRVVVPSQRATGILLA